MRRVGRLKRLSGGDEERRIWDRGIGGGRVVCENFGQAWKKWRCSEALWLVESKDWRMERLCR